MDSLELKAYIDIATQFQDALRRCAANMNIYVCGALDGSGLIAQDREQYDVYAIVFVDDRKLQPQMTLSVRDVKRIVTNNDAEFCQRIVENLAAQVGRWLSRRGE